MSIAVFEPKISALANESIGLVVFNHLGSSVAQDTGRDAKDLANQFGLVVVAADRPGTDGVSFSDQLASDLSTGPGYVAEMTHLGIILNKQIESLGLQKTIVMGRSAGGLGALALTLSETISSQKAVFAAEPFGCQAMTMIEVSRRYRDYQKRQARLQAEAKDIILPINNKLSLFQAIGRLATMPASLVYDKSHNTGIWATNASLIFARHIAKHQLEIDMTLEFAEHSLVISDKVLNDEINRLKDLRKGKQPVDILRTKNTTHASYANRSFLASRLQPVINRISYELTS